MESVRVEPRPGETRCPYCHGDVLAGEPTDPCEGCGAVHHRRCLRDHGACATCARATGAQPLRRPRTPLDFTRESRTALVVSACFLVVLAAGAASCATTPLGGLEVFVAVVGAFGVSVTIATLVAAALLRRQRR